MSSPGPLPNGSPVNNKVVGATAGVGVAGAVTILIDYLVNVTAHVDIPSTVEQAITVLLCALGAFIGGYMSRHR